MEAVQKKQSSRERRRARIRARISGTAERPRLAVSRSNRYITAQLINDGLGTTLVYIDSKGMKGTPKERAHAVGKQIAEAAKKQKIAHAVFDRGGFIYQGRIQAVAEGAREGGLTL